MISRRFTRYSAVVVALLVMASMSLCAQEKARRGRKYKPPPPTSKVQVTVVRDSDSKPIENAAVIFHLDGDKGNMELKTNEDGKSVLDILPIGATMRLQIIAKGYQTYGQDYKIEKSEMAVDVRMKRPGEQYSIYKDHAEDEQKDGAQKDGSSDKPGNSPDQSPKP